jgi:3-dehydroquinate dehydratase II
VRLLLPAIYGTRQVAAPTILVLNGPNLNMLGVRQPEVYGRETLGDIEAACRERGAELDLEVDFRQSNHEGELVDWIQEARGTADGIIINGGALSHTSVAVLDALLLCELPIMEVHLSNIYARDAFRHHSYVSRAARGVICGLGGLGYLYALDALKRHLAGDQG